jgi:hypothetical protein
MNSVDVSEGMESRLAQEWNEECSYAHQRALVVNSLTYASIIRSAEFYKSFLWKTLMGIQLLNQQGTQSQFRSVLRLFLLYLGVIFSPSQESHSFVFAWGVSIPHPTLV